MRQPRSSGACCRVPVAVLVSRQLFAGTCRPERDVSAEAGDRSRGVAIAGGMQTFSGMETSIPLRMAPKSDPVEQ